MTPDERTPMREPAPDADAQAIVKAEPEVLPELNKNGDARGMTQGTRVSLSRYQFPKGVSGNPGGQKKEDEQVAAYKRLRRMKVADRIKMFNTGKMTSCEIQAHRMLERAERGILDPDSKLAAQFERNSIMSAQEIADRTGGKPTQAVAVEGRIDFLAAVFEAHQTVLGDKD